MPPASKNSMQSSRSRDELYYIEEANLIIHSADHPSKFDIVREIVCVRNYPCVSRIFPREIISQLGKSV